MGRCDMNDTRTARIAYEIAGNYNMAFLYLAIAEWRLIAAPYQLGTLENRQHFIFILQHALGQCLSNDINLAIFGGPNIIQLGINCKGYVCRERPRRCRPCQNRFARICKLELYSST
ncbi:hypothetical protein D3C78_1090220 [compost metagenome]